MKKKLNIDAAFYAVLIIVLFTSVSNSAEFGKNNVNYTWFKWKYLTTEHFDIYYNQGGLRVAEFTAEVAEDVYEELTLKYSYYPDDPKPFILVTYQSHNDFQQTNLAGGSPGESVGGFTEFLKNRVVVPFEGDHEKFRHVIHHEINHALYLRLLFGEGLSSIVSGISQARIPLWFTEGISEYQSRGGLDSETEVMLRDAVINDNLPTLRQLDMTGYVGVYKMGQTILYYIAQRYGDEKIGEILKHIRSLRNFENALKASIGIGEEELSQRWRRWIKERYWPQVVKMDEPEHFAQRLTDHEQERAFINNSPAISPNGEWIAFLSDRSDYFDVYLLNTIDGKVHKRLVRGQRSGDFENLHWLRPGISWSSDGRRIAFCAKAGEEDALFIINAQNGDVLHKLQFGTDGLFSPSWSPISDEIALVRIYNGQSDIAIVDLETKELRPVTDDLYDEADPAWSQDGSKLMFTSNRHGAGIDEDYTEGRTLYGYDYDTFDVYLLDLKSDELTQITDDKFVERTPIPIPDKNKILYTTNISGTYNLYVHDLDTEERYSITNNITGAQQPSISSVTKSLAFSCYFDGGYDIFLLNNPFDERKQNTAYETPEAREVPDINEVEFMNSSEGDFSQFVFDRRWNKSEEKERAAKQDTTQIELRMREKDESGRYPVKDYSYKLTPDLVFVNAAYSPYYNMQGSGLIMFSDVIGNHNLYTSLNLYYSFEWSNIYFNYRYLARRMPLSFGFYHYAYLYYGHYNDGVYLDAPVYWQDRNMGVFVTSEYPLDRFNRIELGFNFFQIDRKPYDWGGVVKPGKSRRLTLMPSIGYVHDTSIWRSSIEPGNGSRWRIDLSGSPAIFSVGEDELEFITLEADLRRYFSFRKKYSFAFRLSGAVSEGDDPQRFFLGGMRNWFNPRLDNPDEDVMVNELDDIYYSSFEVPLRGVGFYNQIGNRYVLSNVEFRFPFIQYLLLGWPLPAFFYNVRGAIFADAGFAWSKEEHIQGDQYNEFGDITAPERWARGVGLGVRLDLGMFPLEWDIAWSPDKRSNMKPHYYVSLNAAF